MKRFDATKATDTQLLIRFQDGRDQHAFSELVRRYGQMVMSTGRRVLGNEEDAEDVLQATFLALTAAVQRLRNKAAVGGWLQKTAYQCAVTLQRKNIAQERGKERLVDHVTNLSVKNVDHESVIANEELSKILDGELARLPVKLSAAVILCDLEGLSQKEAARRLGIAASTVNYHVAKARKMLRERLARRGLTLGLGSLVAFGAASRETATAMGESLVSDVTAKALHYAAGKSASEAGVSATVFELASGISTAMRNASIVSACLAALALVVLAGSFGGVVGIGNTAQAGFLFEDNFADGNFADGSPVTWIQEPFLPGSYDASSGNLVLESNADTNRSIGVAIGAMEEVHRNVSVRANVSLSGTTGDNWGAGVAVRVIQGEEVMQHFYVAAVTHSEAFGGSILTAGKPGNDHGTLVGSFNSVAGTPVELLPFDIREVETSIQLDVFENKIEVWAWPAGQQMPSAPAYSVTDDTIDGAGYVNAILSAGPALTGEGRATFSYIGVADGHIPEPSAGVLGSLALGALAIHVRRRRY